MSKLRLYNYNNYINRIFKKEATLEEYGTPIYTLSVTNFNYNDGVDTSHVINYNNQDGDYVIITDDNDNIQSRWFVTENVRNRGGQHNLTLKRDLKVDLYDFYKNSPMIVHRGWPKYFPDPIIFNSEGFSFNQIKQSEQFLKDDSLTPWYILYIAKNCPVTTGTVTLNENYDFTISTPISESIYNDGETYNCYDEREIFTQSNQDQTTFFSPMELLKFFMTKGNQYYTNVQSGVGRDRDYIWFDQNTPTVESELRSAFSGKYSTWSSDSYFGKTNDLTDSDRINLDTRNFVIKDSTNALYQIRVDVNTEFGVQEYNITSNLRTALIAAIEGTSLTKTGDWGDEAFGIKYSRVTYTIHANLITTGSVDWEINFSNKQNTVDADYNIIAIPKQTMRIFTLDNNWHIVYEQWSQALIESILSKIRNYIYDIQLLPYCPYPQNCTLDFPDKYATIYLTDYEEAPVRGLKPNQAYHNSSSDNHLFMLYVEKSQYEFNINKFYYENPTYYTVSNINMQPYNYKNSGDLINYKLDNECRVYRLCSPNYNGLFEFSVAKNNGVNEFNVDVTLRPYNPYIHINPNFKSMYGSDFNDVRGLICQGDFSLPIITDQWQTYEYQNKNYQNIFNRQIENMDFNFEQERIKGIFGAVAGTTVGAAAGGLTGHKIGGPVGAGVGAVLGGASSLAGGIIDYNMMTSRQEEQRDYVIDNYKYQLGNIKALSYSINKVTPLTNNNKIWPFIEMYDCTDTEKEMLYNKLVYTSFTIERIDTMSNYGEENQKRFFSATLIRVEGANQPTHELQELAKELEKGVYI